MREPRQFLRGAISFVIYFAGGNSCFRNAIRAWPLHHGTLPRTRAAFRDDDDNDDDDQDHDVDGHGTMAFAPLRNSRSN